LWEMGKGSPSHSSKNLLLFLLEDFEITLKMSSTTVWPEFTGNEDDWNFKDMQTFFGWSYVKGRGRDLVDYIYLAPHMPKKAYPTDFHIEGSDYFKSEEAAKAFALAAAAAKAKGDRKRKASEEAEPVQAVTPTAETRSAASLATGPLVATIEGPAPAGRLDPTFDQAEYRQFDNLQAQQTRLQAEEESLRAELDTLQRRMGLVQRGLAVTRESVNVAYELHTLGKYHFM